jgi:hypothetical protein
VSALLPSPSGPVLVNAVALDAQTLNVLPLDVTKHAAQAPELAGLVLH